MVRRLFVPVILAALALGVAPAPSFGLGEHDVRLRVGDHFRCMYRCDERGYEPPARRYAWGSWPPPRPRLRPPERPSWRRPGCWLFCGGSGWGHGGWGHGGSGPYWWCGPEPDDRHAWYGHRRPCRPGGHGWYDRRHRDRDGSGGYDAHRRHPRSRDF